MALRYKQSPEPILTLKGTLPRVATPVCTHWSNCTAIEQWRMRKLYFQNNEFELVSFARFASSNLDNFSKYFPFTRESFFLLIKEELSTLLKINITAFFFNADLTKYLQYKSRVRGKRNGIAPGAHTWHMHKTNVWPLWVDPDLCHHIASQGHNVLTLYMLFFSEGT